MKPRFKNNFGFFSFHFVLFLSVISAIMCGYGMIFYAQQKKDLFRKICFYELPSIQKNLVLSEKKLFKLNPLSTLLRKRLQILKIQRLAAVTAQNWPLAAQLAIEIQKVYIEQIRLDQIQKGLISAAETQLRISLIQMRKNIQSSLSLNRKIWKLILNSEEKYFLDPNVQLAIQPDLIGGMGPNYELKPNYTYLQSLNLYLHHDFNNNTDFQTLLNTKQKYRFKCHVSFQKKGDEWHLAINQDKF